MIITFKFFLIVYIAGGSIGLLTGLLNIIQKKGGKKHKLIGRVFYFSILLVFVTFGSLGLLFVRQDFLNFTNKISIKNFWLIGHLQRMTGAFISSMTAFLVINAKYFPDTITRFVYWLLPTIVFTPLIVKWSKKYQLNVSKSNK